ncbi:hypothetical protein [Helicobacter cholecystus]|uniref:hypothetical protein n=1 Tax=Helicobacter cholecystus TaxID=45498 RepID=UPI0013159B20|nr:hypothetical protein [Helicobacter cholecystus]
MNYALAYNINHSYKKKGGGTLTLIISCTFFNLGKIQQVISLKNDYANSAEFIG